MKSTHRLLAAGLLVAGLALPRLAAAAVWVGGTGAWSSPGLWSPPGVPGPGDDVVIGDGATVTLDMAATVNSLTLGDGDDAGLGQLLIPSGSALTLNATSLVLEGGRLQL
jgi:hypothetical protein